MNVLKYVICLLALVLLTISTAAFGSGPVQNPGQGDQNQEHKCGSPPGVPCPQSDELACLFAIASQNPVLIMEACLLTDSSTESVKPMVQVKGRYMLMAWTSKP
jgi:hypothetical protein